MRPDGQTRAYCRLCYRRRSDFIFGNSLAGTSPVVVGGAAGGIKFVHLSRDGPPISVIHDVAAKKHCNKHLEDLYSTWRSKMANGGRCQAKRKIIPLCKPLRYILAVPDIQGSHGLIMTKCDLANYIRKPRNTQNFSLSMIGNYWRKYD